MKIKSYGNSLDVFIPAGALINMIRNGLDERNRELDKLEAIHGVRPSGPAGIPTYLTLRDDNSGLSIRFLTPPQE